MPRGLSDARAPPVNRHAASWYNPAVDLITTHPQADFDGLASMVAARKLYPGSVIVLAGGAQEAVTRFLQDHDLNVSRLHDIDLALVSRVVLVDTQDPLRVEPLKPLWKRPEVVVDVYDHHQDHPAQEEAPRGDGPRIDRRVIERVGATTTLMIEQVMVRGVPFTPEEATVLAVGLYEETGSLTYGSTTARDVEAVAALLRAGADLGVVAATLRKAVIPEQIALLNALLSAADTHYLEGRKILVATSATEHERGDLAAVVAMLMQVEGVDAVLAVCTMDHKIEIVGRSRHPDVDVSWIAREFGGGGHAAAAAATVKGGALVEVRERLTRLLLEKYRPTLLAKNVMTSPAKTVDEDCPVEEVGRLMTTAGVNVLPVLDEQGRYRGLISRETVQKALFHKLPRARAEEFMRTDRYTAGPETPFHDVERHMIEGHQRFVPVLVGQKVVGVITRTDLLRTLHDDVLKRARGRGPAPSETGAVAHGRDVAGMLRERLPGPIVALLRAAGELGERLGVHVYVVGGIVRDLLLGIPNLDVDLVVEGDGIAFAQQLAAVRGARLHVHERFGTARLQFPDSFKLDVATARTEYYEYPTALPTVEAGSIRKDLYRRDFTINTLAIRLNPPVFGHLLDYYGGERDVKDRTIRVLHSLSFVEDPTRIFRAVRFAVRFGFALGRETRALIDGAIRMKLVDRLSPHRLTDEVRLLFSEREPRTACALLAEIGVLRGLHPSLIWSPRLQGLLQDVEDAVAWHRLLYLDRPMEAWVVALLALAEVLSSKAATAFLSRFELSERVKRIVRAARFGGHRVVRALTAKREPAPSVVWRLLSDFDDEAMVFMMAASKSETVKRQVSAYLTTYRATRPILTGDDLRARGIPPGPRYKEILTMLLEARLDGKVVTREDEDRLVAGVVSPPGGRKRTRS